MVRHQAALAAGKLTRVTSGGNLPPSEVMMSRPALHGYHYRFFCVSTSRPGYSEAYLFWLAGLRLAMSACT
jgi:hypothetical protein